MNDGVVSLCCFAQLDEYGKCTACTRLLTTQSKPTESEKQ